MGFRSVLLLATTLALVLGVSAQDFCPAYETGFSRDDIEATSIGEGNPGCTCDSTDIVALAEACGSVFEIQDGEVVCTSDDSCFCYESGVSQGDMAAEGELSGVRVGIEQGDGTWDTNIARMWVTVGDAEGPAQVSLKRPEDTGRSCVLQLGGDAVPGNNGGGGSEETEAPGGEETDAPGGEETDAPGGEGTDTPTPTTDEDDEDEEDDGSVCIEADRIPVEMTDFAVHKVAIPAKVLCVEGSDMPCGTKNHALIVDGVSSSYGQLCDEVACFEKRAFVNAVYKHRWADLSFAAGEKDVKLVMGDSRVPNSVYSAAHVALDTARQVQALSLIQALVNSE